ncbi:MAG: Gfo/Idh/MocA family protein [Jatrophihabitantaceae bacterium]
MGYRQHLLRSLLAIRAQGGLQLQSGDQLWPEIVLVGRSNNKLREIAHRHGLSEWSTDLDAALQRTDVEIYFDAQPTALRKDAVRAAIEAGKHCYTEKPTAQNLVDAIELAELADHAGIKHGVVHDRLFQPGLRKLKRLMRSGFFGRILSICGEFGYWVFEGDWQSGQRPSWNYRRETGGLVIDMMPHWHYVLRLFGPLTAVTAHVVTHIPQRWDEAGMAYSATADDAAYVIVEIGDGIVAQLHSSWTARVHRDELFEFQVDGTDGSAVVGLHGCRIQHRVTTPRPAWDPDLPVMEDFRAQWQEVPDNMAFDNGFKVQWELFLRHVAEDAPYRWDFWSGAGGVQMAELVLRSSQERRRLVIPPLSK